jgi:hypothetical protein
VLLARGDIRKVPGTEVAVRDVGVTGANGHRDDVEKGRDEL